MGSHAVESDSEVLTAVSKMFYNWFLAKRTLFYIKSYL